MKESKEILTYAQCLNDAEPSLEHQRFLTLAQYVDTNVALLINALECLCDPEADSFAQEHAKYLLKKLKKEKN